MDSQLIGTQTWASLAEDARRRACITILEQPADPAWLPVLERMNVRDPSDVRLLAIYAKALCDHREFERAFAAMRRSAIVHAEEAFCGTAQQLPKAIDRFRSAMRLISHVKRYISILHYRETFPRSASDGTMESTFARIRDFARPVHAHLTERERDQLFNALMDFAELAGCETSIVEAAEMYVQCPSTEEIVLYAGFMRRLMCWPNATHDRRMELLKIYRRFIAQRVPNDRAFLKHYKEYNRIGLDQLLEGTEQDAIKLASYAVNLSMCLFPDDPLLAPVRKACEDALRAVGDPGLKLALASRLAATRDPDARRLAAHTLNEYFAHVPDIRPNELHDLVYGLLSLNDSVQLNALCARGLFEEKLPLPLAYLGTLYGVMGRFQEGYERLAEARKAEIVKFAETADETCFTNVFAFTDDMADFAFLAKCSEILNRIPTPSPPRGLIVVTAKGPHEMKHFPILALAELKQRGYVVLPLASGAFEYQPTGIPEIDDIANQFDMGFDLARCELDASPEPHPLARLPFFRKMLANDGWVWDPANRNIRFSGSDIYWGIREDLCGLEKRYSVDFDAPRYAGYLADTRRRIEAWDRCLRRIADVGKARNIPVRLIVQFSHLSTHYYCRKFVQARSSEQDIAVIHSLIAYQNYFENFKTDVSTALAVQDLTKYAEIAAAPYAPRPWFDAHYRGLSEKDRDRIVGDVERIAKQPRVRRLDDTKGRDRLDFFRSERARGRRVAALFGKVLYDQGLPSGAGTAHADMREWFDHTIDIARRNPNLHLVIKPHPHELRDEIALYASEILRDWVPNPCPANIHLLDHDELNLFEVTEVLDVATMWDGSSALELGVLGVPTILGAHYGPINYPVGHMEPRSRREFERLMMTYSRSELSPDVRRRAAALIDYLRSEDVAIPYRYSQRGFTNKHQYARWFDDDLAAYEANGDSYVTAIADRIAGVQRSKDTLAA